MTVSILFVCLGNICRSPLAEAAFRAEAARLGLDVEADSAPAPAAGMRASRPTARAIAAARRGGVDISDLRARQGGARRFRPVRPYRRARRGESRRPRRAAAAGEPGARCRCCSTMSPGREGQAVADPYYGGDGHFDVAWRDVAAGARGLAAALQEERTSMSLVFHGHPLSSYLLEGADRALRERHARSSRSWSISAIPESRAAFAALWPVAKMPVLEDRSARRGHARRRRIIIDYLDRHYRGPVRFVPEDPERAREVRLWDRIYDLYVQGPMQKIVGDRLRPAEQKDPFGVEEARALLATALGMVERAARPTEPGRPARISRWPIARRRRPCSMPTRWMPFGGRYPNALALLERLKARPSFARVLAEAEPYFQYFPTE